MSANTEQEENFNCMQKLSKDNRLEKYLKKKKTKAFLDAFDNE